MPGGSGPSLCSSAPSCGLASPSRSSRPRPRSTSGRAMRQRSACAGGSWVFLWSSAITTLPSVVSPQRSAAACPVVRACRCADFPWHVIRATRPGWCGSHQVPSAPLSSRALPCDPPTPPMRSHRRAQRGRARRVIEDGQLWAPCVARGVGVRVWNSVPCFAAQTAPLLILPSAPRLLRLTGAAARSVVTLAPWHSGWPPYASRRAASALLRAPRSSSGVPCPSRTAPTGAAPCWSERARARHWTCRSCA